MIKILELFGGIGACSKALERLNIDHTIVDYVEVDKYAVKSYNTIHNSNFEPQDITQWDKQLDVDLIMHGSPCQDFSLAGKQNGGDEGSGTRSSLLYETIRIVSKLKPKYVIWENVKNVLSKKHRHNFDNYLSEMEKLGYKNYYQVLNAKDYGIPQNRERVFTVSILGNINFEFPKKQELILRLKDTLENEVDEKYYLSDKAIQGRLNTTYEKYKLDKNCVNEKEIHPTILARFDGAPTLLKIKNATKKGYIEAYDGDSVNLAYQESKTRRGRVGNQVAQTLQCNDNMGVVEKPKVIGGVGEKKSNKGTQWYQQDRIYDDKVAISVTTVCNPYYKNDLRIRKLTPKECFRLMGFDDEDFEKASKVNSNAQLYKQAGNSIVVQVLEAIFRELLGADVNDSHRTI